MSLQCSFIWILLYFKGVWCLRMLALNVPTKTVAGATIRLHCQFDLEGDILYSIKWYRDEVEFFRFVPRDNPPGQYFAMEGVRVDQFRSANNSVILEEIDETTSGTYKCEVSADAPSFQTESVKKMLVVREDDGSSSNRRKCGWWYICFCLLLSAFLW